MPSDTTLSRRAQGLRVVVLPALHTGEPPHLAVNSTGPKLCVCGEALIDPLKQISPGTPMDIAGSDGAYDTKACPARTAACEGAMPWPQAPLGAT